MQSTPTKVLVTGFGPFEEHDRNPSGEVALALDGRSNDAYQIIGRRIDVSWTRAFPQLCAAIEETQPDVLLALGLAAGATVMRAEMIAKNAGAPRKDADGEVPALGPRLELIVGAAAAYFATLPLVEVERCELSTDAGSYLCNFVFYRAMHAFSLTIPHIGFVHVPMNIAAAEIHHLIDRTVSVLPPRRYPEPSR